jgi:hypothetical protein
MKVLFLSANPKKTERLRFDKEFKEIHDSIACSKARKNVTLQYKNAINIKDIKNSLQMEDPTIVHFSGHGNSKGEIILEDNKGFPNPISPEEFTKIFISTENKIKCVILNCCYSASVAKSIIKIVDCSIGIETDLEDNLAVVFVSAFYLALGENKDLQLAFDFATNEFLLKGGRQNEKPRLFFRSDINPSETYLIKKK